MMLLLAAAIFFFTNVFDCPGDRDYEEKHVWTDMARFLLLVVSNICGRGGTWMISFASHLVDGSRLSVAADSLRHIPLAQPVYRPAGRGQGTRRSAAKARRGAVALHRRTIHALALRLRPRTRPRTIIWSAWKYTRSRSERNWA